MKISLPISRTARTKTLILMICVIAIVLERIHTYSEPLENDISGYALIGHELLRGRPLYSDLWERKPPLLFATFAAAECLVGYGRNEILLINLAAALATLAFIYAAGFAGRGGKAGGLIAAIMWTLLSGDLFMQANQPNAEVLINVWMTAAFALLLYWPTNRRWLAAFFLGILFAAATLNKHHLIATCAALAAGHVLIGVVSTLRRRLGEMALSAIIASALWAMVLGYFRLVGRWNPMIDVLFHQNSLYAGDLLHNLFVFLSPAGLFRPFLSWMLCPIGLLIVFAIFAIKQRKVKSLISPHWKLWAVWAVATWPAVALPGHLFAHYYQLWIPVWCVATGWIAAGLFDKSLSIPNVIRYGTVGAALTILTCRELTPYRLSADEWAEQKYRGGNYVQQEYLGRYLGQTLLKPNEQFWVLGDDNSLYFAARRSPPSGLLYVDPLIDGDEKETYNRRLVNDLNRTQPALVILSPLADRLPPQAPVIGWIRKNYVPWHTSLAGQRYLMFVRNGSDLQSRISKFN